MTSVKRAGMIGRFPDAVYQKGKRAGKARNLAVCAMLRFLPWIRGKSGGKMKKRSPGICGFLPQNDHPLKSGSCIKEVFS